MVIRVKLHIFIYRNSTFIKFFVSGLISKIFQKNFKWRKFFKNTKTPANELVSSVISLIFTTVANLTI